MVIRHSMVLLEQLTELEREISKIESLMEKLGMNHDREKMIALIVACQKRKKLPTDN